MDLQNVVKLHYKYELYKFIVSLIPYGAKLYFTQQQTKRLICFRQWFSQVKEAYRPNAITII